MIVKALKNTIQPEKQTLGAAGYDFSCDEEFDLIIEPAQTVFIKTGVFLEIPEGYFMMLCPRSSLALKENLIMPNSMGIIDSDYRGEIKVVLKNIGNKPVKIERGQRIAQGIFLQHVDVEFEAVEELSKTDRGEGGFGSTDKKL